MELFPDGASIFSIVKDKNESAKDFIVNDLLLIWKKWGFK